MSRPLTIFGIALCVSAMEGLWAWLLASAIAEVAGQGHPSLILMTLVLFVGWLATRILTIRDVPLVRRRQLLIGGGLALALTAGTIQAGLVFPLQLLFGSYTPDLRGAGVVLLVLIAYLWGRGLSLAIDVSRERVIGHIALAATALAAVLVFLPLTDVVQGAGLSAVIGSFAIALAALLLVQAKEVESRELTPGRWGLTAGAFLILLLLAGGALTGAFSSGVLASIGTVLKSWGGFMSPVTDTVLLAFGHVSEAFARSLRWVSDTFGVDTSAIVQNMRAAEDARPTFEEEAQHDPPTLLAAFVALCSALFFGAIAYLVFHRLIGRLGDADDDGVEESRAASRGRRGGLLDLFRRHSEQPDADLDSGNPREAIRLRYRRFQTMMARAGLERRNGQTPREYQTALERLLPDASVPLSSITEAYDLARYGDPQHQVPQAEAVDRAVADIRTVLQIRAHHQKSPAASTP